MAMATATTSKVVLLMAFMAAALSSVSLAGLQYDFYSSSCPNAEKTVRNVVEGMIYNDPSMGAAFIRLFFHDCFVRVRNTCLVWYAGIPQKFYRNFRGIRENSCVSNAAVAS